MRRSDVLLFFALLFSLNCFCQAYILPTEELIYSFETISGKKVVLAKAKNNDYIIYRFGSKNKIEFEFPAKTKDSFNKLKYSFYMRGGGPGNEGMDLNYVYFTNNHFQYVIYDTYYSTGDKKVIGIKVIDLHAKEVTDIKGNKKTQKGTLTGFRDNGLLQIGDELFD